MDKIKLVIVILALVGGFNFDCYAGEKRKSLNNFIGLGQMVSVSPYIGGSVESRIIPLVYYRKKNFFLRGKQLGYSFYESEKYLLSAIVDARLMGYSSSQSSKLSGMEDRDYSADAGLQLRASLPGLENTYLQLQYLYDILSIYKGDELKIALTKTWRHKLFRWSWNVGLNWQSSNLLNYYYGVETSEATANRNQYSLASDKNYFISSRLALGLSQYWLLIVGGGVHFLASEIQESPIVENDYSYNFILGVVRRF